MCYTVYTIKQRDKQMSDTMQVKLTYNPIKTMIVIDAPKAASINDVVALCKEQWVKLHQRVRAETKLGDKYAAAFAEVYGPEYSEAMSEAVTIALDKATDAYAMPEPEAKPEPKAVEPKPQPAKKAAVKKPAKSAKGSMAQQVRDMIAANPKLGAEKLIEKAYADLNMPLARAKVYVTGNLKRVRG